MVILFAESVVTIKSVQGVCRLGMSKSKCRLGKGRRIVDDALHFETVLFNQIICEKKAKRKDTSSWRQVGRKIC